MKKKKNDSRKRLNSLTLLIAFTAILLIASTYAWFSTQRDVAITNLSGTVEVADGLQISLDGESWNQSVDLSGTALSSTDLVGIEGKTNIVPTNSMSPVSSSGTFEANSNKMNVYAGKVSGTALSSISHKSETAADGYYAFDIYLLNTSITVAEGGDQLQLNFSNATSGMNSSVTATGKGGAQNAVRVAFALFDQTANPQEKVTKAEVQAVTNASAAKITKVAIWEPNTNAHTAAIVASNNKLSLSSADLATTKYGASGNLGTSNKFTTTSILPTYAVNGTDDITNIYNWGGIADPAMASNLAKQYSLKTSTDGANGYYDSAAAVEAPATNVYNLVDASDGTTAFKLTCNAISRVRVYVWLEGQDVDCTNLASFSGTVKVNIGLTKDGGDASQT